MAFCALALLMSACGDSGNTNQPLFNTSAPERYDINKFKNADYLYESYFGEFGLAPAFKDQISVELQMVANGFALAEAKGEDVQQKMRYADSAIREMFGTREMMKSFEKAALMQAAEPQHQQPVENTVSNPSESGAPEVQPPAEVTPPVDDRPGLIDEGFEAYKKEQERIVKEYNLPYPLPNSASKVLDLEYTLTMKSKKKKQPPPADQPPPPPVQEKYNHTFMYNSWYWHNADIVMAHDPWYENWDANIYGYWRHAGIYTLAVGVIDAYPGKGVTVQGWDFWRHAYQELGGFYYPKGAGASTYQQVNTGARAKIANRAISYLGLPYGISAKTALDKFYCSKLIWAAYWNYDQGSFMRHFINLDSNGGNFVLPDDIANSNLIQKWATSTLVKKKDGTFVNSPYDVAYLNRSL